MTPIPPVDPTETPAETLIQPDVLDISVLRGIHHRVAAAGDDFVMSDRYLNLFEGVQLSEDQEINLLWASEISRHRGQALELAAAGNSQEAETARNRAREVSVNVLIDEGSPQAMRTIINIINSDRGGYILNDAQKSVLSGNNSDAAEKAREENQKAEERRAEREEQMRQRQIAEEARLVAMRERDRAIELRDAQLASEAQAAQRSASEGDDLDVEPLTDDEKPIVRAGELTLALGKEPDKKTVDELAPLLLKSKDLDAKFLATILLEFQEAKAAKAAGQKAEYGWSAVRLLQAAQTNEVEDALLAERFKEMAADGYDINTLDEKFQEIYADQLDRLDLIKKPEVAVEVEVAAEVSPMDQLLAAAKIETPATDTPPEPAVEEPVVDEVQQAQAPVAQEQAAPTPVARGGLSETIVGTLGRRRGRGSRPADPQPEQPAAPKAGPKRPPRPDLPALRTPVEELTPSSQEVASAASNAPAPQPVPAATQEQKRIDAVRTAEAKVALGKVSEKDRENIGRILEAPAFDGLTERLRRLMDQEHAHHPYDETVNLLLTECADTEALRRVADLVEHEDFRFSGMQIDALKGIAETQGDSPEKYIAQMLLTGPGVQQDPDPEIPSFLR